MTENEFRKLALSRPGAVEAAHMGHADFPINGKIFATLEPRQGEAVVKLKPDQQDMVVAAEPKVVHPVKGVWGLKGWTTILLAAVNSTTAKSVMIMAAANVTPAAPKTRERSRKSVRPRTSARTAKAARANR